jgi:electron transfer flavoprotein alpha subunit/transcriptional regulator with XRE-family HTH domain
MKTRKEIWVFGDLRTPRHFRASLKVLAKALPLARAAEASTAMVLIGDAERPSNDPFGCAAVDLAAAASQAASQGAQTVYCYDDPRLAVARTDLYAAVLADFAQRRRPWLVLMALNDFGRETAAICAQRCRAGMIADCAELTLFDGRIVGRCPAWGGQIMADITLAEGWDMAFVTVQPHGVVPAPPVGPEGRIESIVPLAVEASPRLHLCERAVEAESGRRLEEAAMVVVGGAGLGDMRGFALVRELAAAIGAEVGATRPPVLNHWVSEDRLIGQTGKSVRPELLISVGTSGAVQYTAGIAESKLVVAIDRDPKAPIFQWADIGIVADAGTFLPLLTQRIRQLTMRRLADAVCTSQEEPSAAKGSFGRLIRQLRQARDWTVEELAHQTGQTPDFIAQVEEERISPPVAFILRMAQAMKVDPGTFLRKEEQAAIRDRRAQAYYQRTQNYSYATLTPEGQNSHLRAFMVTIEPYHAHKPVAYKHEGEEFIFVMEGDLEFTLGTQSNVLKPGESIHFNSDIPHKLKSLSSTPTRCLVVLYTI